MSGDEKAIRELVALWMEATRAGDVETVLGLMSEDVVFMTAGREPFGKAEFAAASRGMAGMKLDGTSEVVEIEVLGDWAWMRNRMRVVVTPGVGEEIVRSGYTMTILKKQADGKWVIARDANLLGAGK